MLNNGSSRQGLIEYGGETSDDYGIVVSEAPVFDKPVRKMEIYNVPGRNGSILFQQNAFEDVTRSYNVFLTTIIGEDSGGDITSDLPSKVNAITAWLNSKSGYQRLEDSFETDVFRLAYYSGGNEFTDRMLEAGEATLTFTCRPERFYKNAESPVEVSNGDTMTNPTKFASKPLIHIEGTGTVTVSIGGETITAKDLVDYINIDCDRMDAYRLSSENKNDKISGSFPTVKPGSNTITITGTTTKVTITPRYFTI